MKTGYQSWSDRNCQKRDRRTTQCCGGQSCWSWSKRVSRLMVEQSHWLCEKKMIASDTPACFSNHPIHPQPLQLNCKLTWRVWKSHQLNRLDTARTRERLNYLTSYFSRRAAVTVEFWSGTQVVLSGQYCDLTFWSKSWTSLGPNDAVQIIHITSHNVYLSWPCLAI